MKKGEHGYPGVFWKWLDKAEGSQNGEETESQTRRVPMARLYTVFNAQQCELPACLQPFLTIDNDVRADTQLQIVACVRIIADMPGLPIIQHGEARASYRPAVDTINMPTRYLFPKTEHYYSVFFHDLTHSTGHACRLDQDTLRDLLAFGDTNYSKEGLCAEMGAAYLCGVASIVNETVDNSAAYIQG